MKRIVGFTFLALFACTNLIAASRGLPPAQGELPGDPIEGARLYDNWALELGHTPPEGNQPLWNSQETNKRNGEITWRCSECHGWDYKGEDGAYGTNSNHFTGFTGLGNAVGATQEQVLAWLDGSQNPEHNFLSYSSLIALNDLAAFLRTRQIDTDLLINPDTGAAIGRRPSGKRIYYDNCVTCHGALGDQINFGNVQKPLYLGDLAIADPWQTLHKIRFGTPTSEGMPAYEDLDWPLPMIADVLAYTQTLPRGNPEFTIQAQADQANIVESQGKIEPIIYAAFAIVVVVFVSLVLDYAEHRRPRMKRSAKAKRI